MSKGYYSLQYCDTNSILIVNRQGKMKRLYTPFKVACIEDVGELKIGTLIYIEEVATSVNDELIYHTKNGSFLHKYFKITASF